MNTACIIGDTGMLGAAFLSALSPSVKILGISRRSEGAVRANYTHISFDVLGDAPRLTEEIRKGIGVPDVLIYAAGAFLDKPLIDTPDTHIQRMLDVNFLAPFRILKAMLGEYKKEGVAQNLAHNRSVVMVSSAGIDPKAMSRDERHIAPYCGTKAALATLSVGASRETLEDGVRLNVLAPYYFATNPKRAALVAECGIALAEGRENGAIIFCG
jgi:2,3-dihydro-2,3-dihydroxybenzoate dehydrogenase